MEVLNLLAFFNFDGGTKLIDPYNFEDLNAGLLFRFLNLK